MRPDHGIFNTRLAGAIREKAEEAYGADVYLKDWRWSSGKARKPL